MLKLNDRSNFKYFAFFDVDGTLINSKSMFTFLKYFYANGGLVGNLVANLRYCIACVRCGIWSFKTKKREVVNRNYYQLYAGYQQSKTRHLGERWFDLALRSDDVFFNRDTLKELEAHKANGAGIVLVSGSFPACLLPISRYVDADFILASQLEVENDIYTGNLLPPQVIGKGKQTAIQNLMNACHFSRYKDCFAYGDHISDLSMLEVVGNPRVIAGDLALEKHALKNNWTIIGG